MVGSDTGDRATTADSGPRSEAAVGLQKLARIILLSRTDGEALDYMTNRRYRL